jgi:hypothetical protein
MKVLKQTVIVVIAIVLMLGFFVGAMTYLSPLPTHKKLMILW